MKKLFLYPYHGRHNPDQDMENWGFDGPLIGPLDFVIDTYRQHLRIGFEEHKDYEAWHALTGWESWDDGQLQVAFHDDMLQIGDSYYGDWEFQMREVA